MADFNTFADIRKHRRMFADDIPGAHGCKADGAGNALTGLAFATVYRALLQIFIQRAGNRLAHRQRRT